MSVSVLDIYKIRKEFPVLTRKVNQCSLVYLDTAASCQKPKMVLDAMQKFYQNEYATVHRGVYELSIEATDNYQAARDKVRQFLHAKSAQEIVFTKGTTDALNLVALSYGQLLEEGDEVIITEGEHHANIVPWQLLAQRSNLKLRVIPLTSTGEINLLEYEKALNAKTKLVSIAHIFNSIGTINPIESMIRSAHAWGAKVCIDGAQAISHLPIDVQELDADFYAFSAHKAYGPTGVGVLYGKYELLEKMPPIQGGGDMIQEVNFLHSTYQKPPLRFEAGTPPIAEVIGLGAALEFIEKMGLSAIEAYEQRLTDYAFNKLLAIEGVKILGTPRKRSSIISFLVEGIHPLDLGTFLDLKGVAIRTGHHCAQLAMRKFQTEASCRISFGIYNTLEEVDLFIQVLKDTISHLRG